MSETSPKKIKVALQGGGAYGAIEWGILDRLLDDPRFEITGLSGASAGAINAVATAAGMDEGGRAGAKKMLENTWSDQFFDEAVKYIPGMGKTASKLSRTFSGVANKLRRFDKFDLILKAQSGIHVAALSLLARVLKKLEDSLSKNIDFEKLRSKKDGVPVFVGATDMHDNMPRIFDRSEMTVKSMLASCAIPGIIGPVEINGRKYWDGCLSENPSLEPLKTGDDIIIVQTFPYMPLQPQDKVDFTSKAVEIVLNNPMRKDVESIQQDNQRAAKFPAEAKKMGIKTIHTHMINVYEKFPELTHPMHALCFDRHQMQKLRQAGYEAADEWIRENFDHVGHKSTYTAARDIQTGRNPAAKRRSKMKIVRNKAG